MRVAVVQVESVTNGVLEMVRPYLEQAAGQGAELVVLPEGVMHDFRPSVDLAAIAQPLDGPFVSGLSDLASRWSVTIVAGMWERVEGDTRPANTLVVVGSSGAVVTTYRKIHLFDSFGFRESERVLPGEPTPVAFTVNGFTVGLATCYDLRFPELFRLMGGLDVIALPAGWIAGPNKLHHWQTLVTARAVENTAYVVASGLCGVGFTGHSLVVDPMGERLVHLGDDPSWGVADVDRIRLDEVRRINPALEHRRV
ncbi:MAG: carbon-nitrogen hydrolase family protein [Acidimicrobiia bacterium]